MYICRVSKYVEVQRVLQRSVAVSVADVDASKEPITAKDTEVTFSVTFFHCDDFLLARLPWKWLQNIVFCSRFRGGGGCQQEAQNTEVAFSTFFTVMGLLLAFTSASEMTIQMLHSVP